MILVAARYPLEPLAKAMALHLGAHGQRGDGVDHRGLVALADRLGISSRWARDLHARGLTERQADRFAVAIGHHPASVWPDWWTNAVGDGEWYAEDPAMDELDDEPADGSYLRRTLARP